MEINTKMHWLELTSVALNSNFAPAVKQATSQRPAALPHREPRCHRDLITIAKLKTWAPCAV